MKNTEQNWSFVFATEIFVKLICHSVNGLGDLLVRHERYEYLVVNLNFFHDKCSKA